MANCLEHAVALRPRRRLQLRAPTGCSSLSEVIDLLGKPMRRCCRRGGRVWRPPALRRAGVPIPPEMLRQLRFGRGARQPPAARRPATATRYTTRETVLKLREHQRLAPLRRERDGEGYRYEREVEEFLRCSPSVRRPRPRRPPRQERRAAAARPPSRASPAKRAPPRRPAPGAGPDYAELEAEEVIALLRPRAPPTSRRLRRHAARATGPRPRSPSADARST